MAVKVVSQSWLTHVGVLLLALLLALVFVASLVWLNSRFPFFAKQEAHRELTAEEELMLITNATAENDGNLSSEEEAVLRDAVSAPGVQ